MKKVYFKKIFLVKVFWSNILRIKFKIPILDLMLLRKNSVSSEGLYSSSDIEMNFWTKAKRCLGIVIYHFTFLGSKMQN